MTRDVQRTPPVRNCFVEVALSGSYHAKGDLRFRDSHRPPLLPVEVRACLAVAGRRPRLTAAEEAAAVAVLTGRGWSDTPIGEWLCIRHSRVVALRSGAAARAQ
jgi:hypothetical protein